MYMKNLPHFIGLVAAVAFAVGLTAGVVFGHTTVDEGFGGAPSEYVLAQSDDSAAPDESLRPKARPDGVEHLFPGDRPLPVDIIDHWGDELASGDMTIEYIETVPGKTQDFDVYRVVDSPLMCGPASAIATARGAAGLRPAFAKNIVDEVHGPVQVVALVNEDGDYGELWFTQDGTAACPLKLFQIVGEPL